MRIFAVYQLVFFWQITELNTFFLKHIFEIPPGHPLSVGRIALIGLIVAPTLRQYYSYVTDPRCKRVGTQCWVFGAITITEAIIWSKFGLELVARTQIQNILLWLLIQLVMTFICLYICILYAKRNQSKLENETIQDSHACTTNTESIVKPSVAQHIKVTKRKNKTTNGPLKT